MSLTTYSYDDLISEIDANCGVNIGDKAKLLQRAQFNINRARRSIYDASMWWERYLVVSEPRTVSRSMINFNEDGYHAYGAETDIGDLFIRNGDENGKAKYTSYDGDNEKCSIVWDNSTDWEIIDTDSNVVYSVTDSSTTPPLEGWEAGTGEDPGPLLVDLAEIGTCLLVNRCDMTRGGDYQPLKYHVTARGIALHGCELDKVYVTYKIPLEGTYGDGTDGTIDEIPAEWFSYLSLRASRDYQISTRQSNDSPWIGTAQRDVEDAKQDALAKLEEQNISNTIAKRIQTHLQYSTQLQ